MELTQEEIERINKLLSAKPIDRNSVEPAVEVSLGCEFCTGNCVGSCKSLCSDLQESSPCPEQEDGPMNDFFCDGCDNCCDGSCYQGCGEGCSGECRNSCDSRCGATCEFCCEDQCEVTASDNPKDFIRMQNHATEDDDGIPI